MRAPYVIHELALNGAVVALLRQVRHMRARGETVTILTPQLTGANAALEGMFRDTGATLTVEVANLGDHDVAIGCTVFAEASMSQLAGRIPTVWWIHEGRAGANFIVTQPTAMDTVQRVGKLVFPSWGVVEHRWKPLLSRLPPGRVEIIPAGIPPSTAGPAVPRPDGVSRILCVGTISPRKRQADLVHAVSLLAGPPLQCVLAGQNLGLEASADDLIRANPDRYMLTGAITPDEVPRWYRSSDVFSLPSADESLAIAPLEAAGHGVPVILSDLECYDGIWRHGINALIHPTGDVDMLAWYIRMLLESPQLRDRFVSAGRAVAIRFSEQRAGAMFDATLAEAIAAFRISNPRTVGA